MVSVAPTTGSLAPVRVRLLGGFSVIVDGRAVPETAWRQRRAATILMALALEPGHRLHRERLMDMLWPEFDLAAQANNLRQMLHHARRQLEAAGLPKGIGLGRDGELVILAPGELVWVDVHAFEHAVAVAWRNLSPATAAAALDLYAGDLLPDAPYEEWVAPRREALRASYLALLTRLGQYHAERSELTEAIGVFQRLVAVEPAQEAAHVGLIRLHARAGQRDLALAQYDRLVLALERELAAEPEPTTRALARAIAAGSDPTMPVGLVPDAPEPTPDLAAGIATLPTPVSTLVGREREIAEVRQLLATGRLVTLTGPGGIGKSRLALAVAHALAEAGAGASCFADLTPLRDPALVLPAIARALDVRATSAQPLLTALADRLRDRPMLLVLDNVEQVVEAASDLAVLLEAAPRLQVLATSRMRLGLRGERPYPVPALAVPDPAQPAVELALGAFAATALFVARARDLRPTLTVDRDDAGAVAEICRRLDGLPLAIELAAARSVTLPPRALLARLDRPLTLLTDGARDLPPRQRTLRATIAWSHDLLDADEQRLFRQLAVFAGGWTAAAAAAVVEPGDRVADLDDRLAALIDKSLVEVRQGADGTRRFGMLETVREFGVEQLTASGELPAVCDRHAAHFVALAEQAAAQLETAEQAMWLARLDRDDDNLRAALEWLRRRGAVEPGLCLVTALKLYWYMRGRLVEGYQQATSFTGLAGSAADPICRLDALNAAGFLAREYGDYAAADAASRTSLALSRQVGDERRGADAMANLGYVALQQGRLDDARDLFQGSLATYRALDNQQGVADALSFLALTAFHRGDLATARRLNEESLVVWTGQDDLQATIWARTRLGNVLIHQGDHAAAYGEFALSIRACQALDFRWGLSWAFDGLAQLAAAHDAPQLAARLVAAAAAVRLAAGIALSPVEQAEADHLLDQLRATIGAEALADARSHADGWSPDDLLRAVGETLPTVRAAGGQPSGAG